jgi:hypothetical protein
VYRRTRSWFCIGLVLGLVGCGDSGTEPKQPDPSGTYSEAYSTPGPLIYSTTTCDRYLQYAITSLGQGAFELSMNVFEDCRRTGNSYSSWEVWIRGTYTTADTTLAFTPVTPGTAPYAGTFDDTSMRITVPPRPDSLSGSPIPIELVKRS